MSDDPRERERKNEQEMDGILNDPLFQAQARCSNGHISILYAAETSPSKILLSFHGDPTSKNFVAKPPKRN